MSETRNPFAPVLSTQRRLLEQSRRTLHRSVEMEQRANDLVVDGLASWRSVQRSGSDVARTAVMAYLDAMARGLPGGDAAVRDLEEIVAGQFDAADEISDETWDALVDAMEENARASEAFAEQYLEVVDGTYEGALDSLSRFERETTAAGASRSE